MSTHPAIYNAFEPKNNRRIVQLIVGHPSLICDQVQQSGYYIIVQSLNWSRYLGIYRNLRILEKEGEKK